MTAHHPQLPEREELNARDFICSARTPWHGGSSSHRRVFHEAGPVAYTGPGTVLIRCIHCGREFADDFSDLVTDKTLTSKGAA